MDEFGHCLDFINNCDRDQPLISETKLGQRLDRIPLNEISPKDLTKLCRDLNLEQLITTKQGLARDFRGICELMGFSTLDVETYIKKSSNPTRSAIEAYVQKECNANTSQKNFTLRDLIRMIERIERFDVIDDFIPEMIRIAQCNCSSNATLEWNKQQVPNSVAIKPHGTSATAATLLTIDDTRQQIRTCYDAFVCFAPEDYKHAKALIFHLEQHGKTVATSSDLLPGNFEHDSLVQLIDRRCRKVIIILTPYFLRSKECEFQTKFANEIGIKAGSPKIIPVLCEACDELSLPPLIRVISKIDLTDFQSKSWQLNKLLSSLTYIDEIQINQSDRRNESFRAETFNFSSSARSTADISGSSQPSLNEPSSERALCSTLPPHVDPVVELMHSETSELSSREGIQRGPPSSDKEHSNKPLSWLRQKLRRATTGSQALTNQSSSSRAGLLSDTSSELISEENPRMNVRM